MKWISAPASGWPRGHLSCSGLFTFLNGSLDIKSTWAMDKFRSHPLTERPPAEMYGAIEPNLEVLASMKRGWQSPPKRGIAASAAPRCGKRSDLRFLGTLGVSHGIIKHNGFVT